MQSTGEGTRVPALNIEIVQKQTERQRLIQQMLQPGDQYGFESSQAAKGGADAGAHQSVVVQSMQKTAAAGMFPSRHTKLPSEGLQQPMPHHATLKETNTRGGQDLYGMPSRTNESPLGRKKLGTATREGASAAGAAKLGYPSGTQVHHSQHPKTRQPAMDTHPGAQSRAAHTKSGKQKNERDALASADVMLHGGKEQQFSNVAQRRPNLQKSGAVTSAQGDGNHAAEQLDPFVSKSGQNWNMTTKTTQRVGFLVDTQDAAKGSGPYMQGASFDQKKQTPVVSGVTTRRAAKHMLSNQEPPRDASETAQFLAQQERFKHQLKELNAMGGEIARLKNENRRTKTSIQRMKSFHNQRKIKGGPPLQHGDTEGRRGELSNLSKHNSDRKHYRIVNQSYESQFSDESGSHGQDSEAEFRLRRKSMRQQQVAAQQRKSTRNQKDRVATANGLTRRSGYQNAKSRLLAKELAEAPPQIKHTESKLDLLYERLKQCHGDGGMIDPAKVLDTMNMVQIEENPDAYVPNIEKLHRRREELRRIEKVQQEQCAQRAYDQDRALFDFDESVDHLSEVSDRYAQPDMRDAPPAVGIQGEELHSHEEQGKVKAANHYGQNEERPSPIEDVCASRKDLEGRLSRHMSDMTPKPSKKRVKGAAGGANAFDPLRKSRISDAELKQEIIKDLTGSKVRKDGGGGSKKQMKRNVSSQLINYVEKPRFSQSRLGKGTTSSHMSESSAKKIQEINYLHNKLNRISCQLEEKQAAYLRNHTDSSPVCQDFTELHRKSSAARKGRKNQPDVAGGKHGRNAKRQESYRASKPER